MIVVDLGSNTIRFLAVDKNGRELWQKQVVVRTAEGMHKNGKISDAALDRVMSAIKEAKSEFDFTAHSIRAVATEAVRSAKNQKEVLETLRGELDFEVISQEMEAELTAKAVAKVASTHLIDPPFLVLDIGGASCEVGYFDGVISGLMSYDFGIVLLAEKDLEEAKTREWLKARLADLVDFIADKPKTNALIATSGTPTTLAAIKHGLDYTTYDKEKVNGTILTLGDIATSYQKLLASDQQSLEKLVGTNRSDLVITGCIILEEFIKALDYENCVVFDEGLREGLVL